MQLSKRLASVAILTSIYDGDTFEFLIFNKGKQADAAVSDPGSHQGGLKFLSGKRRAQNWLDMFYMRDFARASWSGSGEPISQRRAPSVCPNPARRPSLRRLYGWRQRLYRRACRHCG